MKQGFQASKWLKLQALLDTQEIRNLLDTLGDFSIYLTGKVRQKNQSKITKESFIQIYDTYLKNKFNFENLSFSALFTQTEDSVIKVPLDSNRELIHIKEPVIQLQHHRIGFSKEEKKFRPMIMGSDSISWGLQFAFARLYQDPQTEEIYDSIDSLNAKMFRTLQKWLRINTIPTPFVVDREVKQVPMRIGKKCLYWINDHPHLKSKNIYVHYNP